MADAPAAIEANASVKPLDWKALLMAGFLALGFSSTFLGPVMRIQTPTHAGGIILGDSDSRPLTVPVTIIDSTTTTILTQPASGLVTDALARAAAVLGGSLSYTSRGASIYLQKFSSLPNSPTGTWAVRLNGLVVVDLSQPVLSQGDRLSVEYVRP